MDHAAIGDNRSAWTRPEWEHVLREFRELQNVIQGLNGAAGADEANLTPEGTSRFQRAQAAADAALESLATRLAAWPVEDMAAPWPSIYPPPHNLGGLTPAPLGTHAGPFASAYSTAEIAELILQQGLNFIGALGGTVYVTTADGQGLQFVTARHLPESALGSARYIPMPAAHPLAQVARTGEALWLPEAATARARFPLWDHARPVTGLEASACIPLCHEGYVLGTLELAFTGARSFSAEETDFLLTLGRQGGQALERVKLYEAEAAQTRLALLAEVSSAFLQSMDYATTLATTARLIVPRLGDCCVIYVLESNGAIVPAAYYTPDERKLRLLRELAAADRLLATARQSVLAQVLRSGSPLFIADRSAATADEPPADAIFTRLLDGMEAGSVIVMPLAARSRMLGALVLMQSESGRRYGAPDVALAEELARRAALAMENILLYAEARMLNAELEQRVAERTLALATELSERQRAEAAITESHEQLRRLSARVNRTREEERKRIAREVHDELGGALTALKMDVTWVRKNGASAEAEALAAKAGAMSQLIDTTVQTVRRIATDLRPGILDDFGLLAAIEWQLQEFGDRAGLTSRLHTTLDELDLDPDCATAIFRVFQETLTNVARHAEASEVDVTLAADADWLNLEIRDNGRGIAPENVASGKSLGLVGMRERVHLLRGEIEISGGPHGGTTVLIKVPIADWQR